MLSVCIGYEKQDAQWLTLPTDHAEVYEVVGKIREAHGWEPMRGEPFIRFATSEISNLPSYLEGYTYSMPDIMNQLNFLAARIAWMNTREKNIFSRALEIVDPEFLWQLIEITYNLDQFEEFSDTVLPDDDKQWNHIVMDEEFYKNPFGMDTAFFLHVHTDSGPGKSSFALRLPQKEKIWDRFEIWVGTAKPSGVKTIQCGGMFGELWDYLPANCTWREVDDFANFLISQEFKDPAVLTERLIRSLEASRSCSLDEVYEAIAGTLCRKKDSNTCQTRLFSPLEGELFTYNERGRLRLMGYQLTSRDLLQYQQPISEMLKNEEWLLEHPCGFVEQLENKLLRQRVISMIPTIQEWKGELWGVLEVKSNGKLLPEELDQMIAQWRGIAATGWGHQIRTMGLKIERGELHLGFWNSRPDFCVLTETQLKNCGLEAEKNQTRGFSMI